MTLTKIAVGAGRLLAMGAVAAGCARPVTDAPVSVDERQSPALFCGRVDTELTAGAPRPYNAVGFLNNGCTAFLIDANHIAAAGHCFTNWDGTWQPNLRFYPNFHPSYVTANRAHVPRATVSRAIVGARAWSYWTPPYSGVDWGIAALTGWADTAGMDLTPMTLAPNGVPPPGTAVINPAYNRAHLPYNDQDSVTWDNMEWDNRLPGPGVRGGCAPGQWAVVAKDAPYYTVTNGVPLADVQNCNSRWSSGFIHDSCALVFTDGDQIQHNCNASGGSSGSPVFYNAGIQGNLVVGITRGSNSSVSDPQFFTPPPPPDGGAPPPSVCDPGTNNSGLGNGPSVTRFVQAPRFASNVAVHARPDNPSATAVFVVDGDRNQVVWRARSGAAPGYADGFSWWSNLGTPALGATLTNIAACGQSGANAGRPQIFVTAGNSVTNIYARAAQSATAWSPWSAVGLPPGITAPGDIDAAVDANGRCQLFMVASGGNAYTKAMTSDTTWGSWTLVAGGTYKKITALNYSGLIYVAMVDTTGNVWHSEQTGGSGWTVPVMLSAPNGLPIADVDFGWTPSGVGMLFAAPSGQVGTVYTSMLFPPAYQFWSWYNTHLYAPEVRDAAGSVSPQPAPPILSLTASHWMEDAPGVFSPVVFGTDDQGNLDLIEYQSVRTQPNWDLDWKPFYEEIIPHYQVEWATGFESPSVGGGQFGSFQYDPPVGTGQPWTFVGSAGVSGNASGFTSDNPNAPQGWQVAFIQSTGSMRMNMQFPVADNRYRIILTAAQRVAYQGGPQTVNVLVNNNLVGTLTPADSNYNYWSSNVFSIASAGYYNVELDGTATWDGTLFIDQLQLQICPVGDCYGP
jgi:hypothetical protein